MWFEAEANSTDKRQPFEIKTEDITEHDDKPRPYLCTVCEESFSSWHGLRYHKIFTLVDTSAQIVANVLEVVVT